MSALNNGRLYSHSLRQVAPPSGSNVLLQLQLRISITNLTISLQNIQSFYS